MNRSSIRRCSTPCSASSPAAALRERAAAEPPSRACSGGEGTRLSPSHAVKNRKRYRYYVSQTLLQGRGYPQNRVTRIPAHDLEAVVIAELRSLLQNPGDLLEILGPVAPDLAEQDALLQAAADLAGRWPTLQPAQIKTVVRAVIDHVVVRTERITIALSPVRLRDVLHAGPTTVLPFEIHEVDDRTVTRSVCARLERRGGATKLIVPARAGAARPRSPNPALIKALVRAQHWLEQLKSGQASGMRTIARAEDLTDRYVAKILPLAFLAPDIKEAILRGTQPVDLTLDQLCRSLPLAWFEQRQVLGFDWPQGCHGFPAATSNPWHGRPPPPLTQHLQVHEP